ncbi:MAG: hypothetical protein KAT37_01780 [Candidatus Aenigmarchaeota archaeon]|nr:hypothetical protein [Candidatus Aenigmarchaeota archaeon]
MIKRMVFCNPEDTYKGKSEEEVARIYTKMAIEDYDKLISFEESYMPHVETPDYVRKVSEKENRDLMLTLFAKQPVTRVGQIKSNFTSSSYLFNPASDSNQLLPDLDVIELEGGKDTENAAYEIASFYVDYGWSAAVVDTEILKTKNMKPDSNRFGDSLEIKDPKSIINLAAFQVDYNKKKFCF